MIRDERSADAAAIRAVLIAAFPEPVEADLVDGLRLSCPDRISLVAVEDDRVVGHPEYYPRFGFTRASKYGVHCRWGGVPEEAFMVLVLEPSIASQLAGLAKYRPEFDEAV